MPFQVDRVPHLGKDEELRAGDEPRHLIGAGHGSELIEGAVDDQSGNGQLRQPGGGVVRESRQLLTRATSSSHPRLSERSSNVEAASGTIPIPKVPREAPSRKTLLVIVEPGILGAVKS